MNEEKYRFLAEWFDPTIKVKREFLITYYPYDHNVDMYDIQLKRSFLRKTECQNIDISDFFIGSMVNILSRQLYITGFGDTKTQEKFSRDLEATIVIINFSGFQYLGSILTVFEKNNFAISRGKMINQDRMKINCSSLETKLEKKYVVLELRGENCFNVCARLLIECENATVTMPLRAELGGLKKYCLGQSDKTLIKQEINIFFPLAREIHCNSAIYENTTCCIIKPHAVREGRAGEIVQDIINANYEITAFEIMTLDFASATEFLEVYKGVVTEYKDMVAQLVSGPCIALEVKSNRSSKTPEEFRNLVGPSDPEIARKLRPDTLRAKYGVNKVKNAVYCTDLPEDAKLDVDYMFRVMFA